MADAAAKQAALMVPAFIQMPPITPPTLPWEQVLQDLQAMALPDNQAYWHTQGLTMSSETGLLAKEGEPGIPKVSAPLFISHYHGIDHKGWKATAEMLTQDFK